MVFVSVRADNIIQMPVCFAFHNGVYEVRVIYIATVNEHIVPIAGDKSRIGLSHIDEVNGEAAVFRYASRLLAVRDRVF